MPYVIEAVWKHVAGANKGQKNTSFTVDKRHVIYCR